MNDTMTLSQRADALEEKMSRELDYIVIKSRLYSMAEGDTGPAPNAGALMADNPNARVLMGDDPRLPPMPEKPTLIDFFKYRFGPAAHLLQSARHAVNAGLPENMVLACLLHDISTIGFIRGDHGYWGAQLVEPYVDEEVTWAIRAHQVLRFYPDEIGRLRLSAILHQDIWRRLPPRRLCRRRLPAYAKSQMVHVGQDDHGARHLLVRPERACRARRIHRCDRPQFPPAATRVGVRQQPGRTYVAGDDPAGEISIAPRRRVRGSFTDAIRDLPGRRSCRGGR